MNDPTRDPDNRPPDTRWPSQPPHRTPRIEHALDEQTGLPRRGILLAYRAGSVYPVGVAARVAGSDPEQWVAHRLGSGHYQTGLSEPAARELLEQWAAGNG